MRGLQLQLVWYDQHEKLPIKNLISKYLEGMTMTGNILPPECVSHSTTPKFHLELTTKQKQSGERTKCALHILANYYRSKNFAKWLDLFSNEEGFVRLFARLQITERHTRFSKYRVKKVAVEMLRFFPWEDPRRYTPEAIARIKKGRMILAAQGINVHNFVTKHKS